jgi:murein DD-endopeptidase MepM/ murein hydrolase activator NlpD
MVHMIYPICLFNVNIYPLLGGHFNKMPAYLPFGDDDELLLEERRKVGEGSQEELQAAIWRHLDSVGAKWAVSGYPEKRELLGGYKRIRSDENPRPYHIGVDITVPAGTKVYAPLDGEVVISEYEEGPGNYGGLIVLKHDINGCIFYSVYGHMDALSLLSKGTKAKAGAIIGIVGNMEQNGGWGEHIHLQVLTQKGFDEGWAYKALCSKDDLKRVAEICPNPMFLVRIGG